MSEFNPAEYHRTREKNQLVIPYTSKEMYISGIHALNIPQDGQTADWHPEVFYFDPLNEEGTPMVRLAGEGQAMNTNPVLGDYGVNDATEQIQRLKLKTAPGVERVYVASHPRAILDLLAFEIQNNGKPTSTKKALEMWVNPQDRDDAIHNARLLESLVDAEQIEDWIRNQH